MSAASGLPAMLGRSLWAHCETWFLFFIFFSRGFSYLGRCLLSPFFFYTGHLETVGYASWTCFFFFNTGVHLGVAQGHTHQWGLMGKRGQATSKEVYTTDGCGSNESSVTCTGLAKMALLSSNRRLGRAKCPFVQPQGCP